MARGALRYGEKNTQGDAGTVPWRPPRFLAAKRQAVELEIARDIRSIEAVEREWNELFEKSGRSTQLFQSFNWCWHWCRHYLDDDCVPAVVLGRRNGKLVLVSPLVIERVAGLRVLSFMGAPVTQYGDFLIDDEVFSGSDKLVDEAWEFATRYLKPDIVWLRKVRADAAISRLLVQSAAVQTERQSAPFMDLSSAGDFEAHFKRRSARFRKRQRAAAKRLDAMGAVTCEHLTTEGSEARQRSAHAIDLKRAQLAADGIVSAAVDDPRLAKFFASIAADTRRPVGLKVDTLSIDGEAAATNIFLSCKGRAALHVVAYDLRYEKASVGSLLLQRTIAAASAAGYRTFDFLAPADSYKLRWADGSATVSDWAIPLTWRGRAFVHLYLRLARPAMKRVFNALPLRMRQAFTDFRRARLS